MDTLIEKIVNKKNPSVIGLDPKLDYVPDFIKKRHFETDGCSLKAAANAIYEYNKCLIDALSDIIPAVKPQLAYYEMYGYNGVRAYERTVRYAQLKGIYVITDGKRNDIGATMDAYSTAYFGDVEVGGQVLGGVNSNALTVNGYLGTDGIKPLLELCLARGKSIFVLVKTSNSSSGELQDLKLENGETVYSRMGSMCEQWGRMCDGVGNKLYGYSKVGAVVGATYPEQLAELRKRMPNTFFLVPGYGAQGGGNPFANKDLLLNSGVTPSMTLEEKLAKIGVVVNSSRAVMLAYKSQGKSEDDFDDCARTEAIRMRDELCGAIA